MRGFVYVADGDEMLMAGARAGAHIRLARRGPPWIVVDHAIGSVIVARWPGRLWSVAVTDDATPRDIRDAGAGELLPDAGYTRALAVEVLEELPIDRLFGARGAAVCAVIGQAERLDTGTAQALAWARHPDADAAYSRAWNRWLAQVKPTSIHLGDDHSRVLAMPGGGTVSPINRGFCVIHGVVSRRARQVAGEAAFRVDEEGDVALEPGWDTTAAALYDAAMALGAPALVDEEDRVILTAAWQMVVGG